MSDAPTTGPEAAEVGDKAGAESEEGISAPENTGSWWQFESKDDAEMWANDLVQKRLTRHKKSVVDPIETERDTLRSEVERLKAFEDAAKTDEQRRQEAEAAREAELAELRTFKAQTAHSNLVRDIANELGLPASFIPRVRGDNEDAIRTDVTELLNALSEGGSTPGKKVPPAKSPKGTDEGDKNHLSAGGGGNDDESIEDIVADVLKTVAKDRANGGLVARR